MSTRVYTVTNNSKDIYSIGHIEIYPGQSAQLTEVEFDTLSGNDLYASKLTYVITEVGDQNPYITHGTPVNGQTTGTPWVSMMIDNSYLYICSGATTWLKASVTALV